MMKNITRVKELLSEIGEKDECIGNMLRISKAVEQSDYKQKGYLGIIRSDYMYDSETNEPKLIEVNTIASSFGVLAWGANQIHQVLAEKSSTEIDMSRLKRTKNPSVLIPEGLKQAYDLYFDTENADPSLGIVLLICGKNERNVNDIGILIDNLESTYQIKTKYADFDQVNANSEAKEGKLFYEGQEVAIIYYRHGYDSSNYEKESDWTARETLELSQAIKCPSIDLQLLTLKKVQEFLSSESIWQEFNGTDLEDIRKFFTGMWGLSEDTEETRAIIQEAKEHPEKFVLKPQREGGGHNFFGDQIKEELEKKDELWQYSLMARIFPVSFRAILMREGKIWEGESVSEVGIFGKLLVKLDEEHTQVKNEEIG
mmetsp:Transcript_16109/g.15826  ORF Transcript_16109/g.15826 Transcript_16109/m.15826 type:complete len:371 (-) Transcript_16109:116-1228(-)